MLNNDLKDIFFSQYIKRIGKFKDEDKRLAYYTSIDIAEIIMEKRMLWMRNVGDMNDYKEVKYGNELITRLLYGKMRNEFEDALETNINISKNRIENILYAFSKEMISWSYNTYATCFAEIDSNDNDGRLSMWRGYGRDEGIALVFDITKMQNVLSGKNIELSPVEYYTEKDVAVKLKEMIGQIERNGERLKRYKKDEIESAIINALRYAVVSIKHPGFEDEKEWRLVAHGNDLNLDVEKVKGLLQPIYKLKISDCIFREGLEKVIFAPSTNILTCKAFVQLLCKNLGISKEEAERKIFMSSIPYR